MTVWTEPKVDWKTYDKFNIEDYNRIKNNLTYLHEKSIRITKYFEIENMGDDMEDYSSYWDVNVFNMFEQNLEKINENSYQQDYGISQKFYENGAFIKYDELNRIESATLNIKTMLDKHEGALRRVPFVLGRFRSIRI